jgi:hypothetical protein
MRIRSGKREEDDEAEDTDGCGFRGRRNMHGATKTGTKTEDDGKNGERRQEEDDEAEDTQR